MVWLSKRLHLQLSHIHDCKKYPNRVVKRVSDLDAESLPSYQKRMDLVQANQCKSIAGSPAAKQDVASPRTSCSETAGSSMDSKAVQHPKIKSFDIPDMFKTSSPLPASAMSSSESSSSIPHMFATVPHARDSSALMAQALQSPAPPAARGGINAFAAKVRGDKKTATAAEKGPMGKIKMAHAVKGNIRV